MIRALIFDFDGLLFDTETPLIAAHGLDHAGHGGPFDRERFLRSTGHADHAFEPWHGLSPHADRAALELDRRALKDRACSGSPFSPGILALFDAARALALPRGLAFNSPHAWCDAHLTRLGLLDCFSFLACGGDTPSPKPESDLDKRVLNRRGLRGHEAIAFEDSSTGRIAAKRAFSHTVVCPGPSTAHHDFSYADLRVASVADIWPWTCSCSLAAT